VDLNGLRADVADASAVVAAGSRTQWEVGDPVGDAHIVHVPAGVVDYEPEDMTIAVGAGLRFGELDHVLGERGQECALDPRDPNATVGGILSCGLSGTRRLRHGPVRDHVLEVRFVTAGGRVVKGGGPTVKNVTGYDLPRLMVGAFGTLGVLAQVTLRCRPRAPVGRWFTADRPPERCYRPASILWDGTAVYARLEGTRADVEHESLGLRATDAPKLPDGAHRGRVSVAPGAVAAVTSELRDTRWCAEVGVGTVHVAADTAAALLAAREVAHRHGGWLLREAGGDGMSGFGRPLPNRALMARIKAAFDPTSKLAPGRLPL
jgi:FAD/FMN-containing dehydrogenase